MDQHVRARSRASLALAGLLLLAGCGGGGGGSTAPAAPTVSGNGFARTSGPGDTSAYLPSAAGDQWNFNYTTTDPTAMTPFGLVTVAVNGTKTIQGATATVFTRTDPTVTSGGYDQYFGYSGGGVTAVRNTDSGRSPMSLPRSKRTDAKAHKRPFPPWARTAANFWSSRSPVVS